MIFSLILILLLIFVLYKYFTRNDHYWRQYNIPYYKRFPIFGERALVGLVSVPDEILENYQKFPDSPFFGGGAFGSLSLIVKDPNLIRDITVKHFDHFLDHSDILVKEKLDPVFGASLVFLKGERWKNTRSVISPLFTGRKMRIMFDLIVECCDQFLEDYTTKIKTQKSMTLEIKDLVARLTSDITATCAFGIKSTAALNENDEFYLMSKQLLNIKPLRVAVTSIFTSLCELFNFGLLPKNVYQYFGHFIHDTIKIREERNIFRPDMIQLIMQAQKEGIKETEDEDGPVEFAAAEDTSVYFKKNISKLDMTNDEILGQVIIFVLGGFETSSTLMSFAAYELALNMDIQSKLQKEIDDTLESCNGKITYEKIKEAKYLDMVINETLRRYPPGAALNRVCTKDFKMRSGNLEMTVEKGMNIQIPVIGIHLDHKNYPNPYKFDPERFNDKNKKEIKDFTFLPFGSGPRNCIGSRFALMQTKLVLFSILSRFNFSVCSKTQIPIKYLKTPIRIAPEKGVWIELTLREKFCQ